MSLLESSISQLDSCNADRDASRRITSFPRELVGRMAATAPVAGGREAAARRAPQHRAARRACAGARRQLDRRSRSAPPRPRHLSAVRGQRPRAARRLPHAGRRRADGAVRLPPAADWLLDNFHLVTAEITDIRRNLPRTLLPDAADAGLARARRAGADLRDGRRADPPQRQPARPPAADRSSSTATSASRR